MIALLDWLLVRLDSSGRCRLFHDWSQWLALDDPSELWWTHLPHEIRNCRRCGMVQERLAP